MSKEYEKNNAKRAWELCSPNDKFRQDLSKLNPTALRTFFQAASRAVCLEEVLILLDYQKGRYPKEWTVSLVQTLQQELKSAVKQVQLQNYPNFDNESILSITNFLGHLVRIHRAIYKN